MAILARFMDHVRVATMAMAAQMMPTAWSSGWIGIMDFSLSGYA